MKNRFGGRRNAARGISRIGQALLRVALACFTAVFICFGFACKGGAGCGVSCDFGENGCGKIKNAATKYEINAEYSPDTQSVTGTVKVEFFNETDNALDALKFQLYANAYRKDATYKAVSAAYAGAAYYAGESYGETSVTSVNGCRGFHVGGADKNILTVDLEYPLYPKEKIVIDISFVTKLADVAHRTGVTKRGVNLGNFYPILCGYKDGGFFESVYNSVGDPFYLETADYKLTFTAPKEYAVASSCVVRGEKSLESKKEYTMYATNVREIALFAYQKYRVYTAEYKGIRLKYYALDEENAEENLGLVKDAFAFYSSTFGGYPYREFSVAEAEICFDGVEYPALSIVKSGLSGTEKKVALAHEVAHQWWYAAVGSDQTKNAWQDEGLAEYSAVLFFKKHAEYGVNGGRAVENAYAGYRAYVKTYLAAFGASDTRMTRDLSEYLSEYEYCAIAYDKGVILLDTLRKSVGDKKFFAALKGYYRDNVYGVATPQHFIGAFEKAGVDVSGLVESFLDGKGVI